MKTIQIGEAFSRAWEGTKNNWLMLLVLGGIYAAVSVAGGLAQELMLKSGGALGGVLAWLLSFFINVLFWMLVLRFSLKVAEENGAKVELFSEMEVKGSDMLRYLLTYLLMTAALLAALAACMLPVVVLAVVTVGTAVFSPESGAWKSLIGPGLVCVALGVGVMVYLGLALSQMVYACVHQGLGPVESFHESWRLTENAKGGLFLMGLASAGIVIAGLLCLLVGVIPASMVAVLAQPVVYFSLLEQSGPRPAAQRA